MPDESPTRSVVPTPSISDSLLALLTTDKQSTHAYRDDNNATAAMMFGNLISTESPYDAPPAHLCEDFNNAYVAHLDTTSSCSQSTSTDSSSDDEYHGPVFYLDTGATGSYGSPSTPLDSARLCNRHVSGISGNPVRVFKQGPCGAIPNVGICKEFKRNLASVHQLAVHHKALYCFGADKAYIIRDPTRLPPSAAAIGMATPQGLYALDMNTLLRVLDQDVLSSGEAVQPDRQTSSRDHANFSYEKTLERHTAGHQLLGAEFYDQFFEYNDSNDQQCFPVADYHPAENTMLLHQRMGHASKKTMIQALKAGINMGVKVTVDEVINSNIYCQACATSHINRKPFPRKTAGEPHKTILGLIHTDTAGPRPRSLIYLDRLNHKTGYYKYWQIYVDDHSKYLWCNFLRRKSELPSRMRAMKRLMELDARDSKQHPPAGQRPLKVQAYRSDNAGELTSKEAVRSLLKAMIDHERTVPGSSQQNANAEASIKVVQDMARTLLDSANLHLKYWPFAIQCAVYLINRLPSTTNPEGKSRYEMFHGRMPDYKHLKSFGAVVTKFLPINKRRHGDKQSPSGEGGGHLRLVGYPRKTKGYLVLDKEKDPLPKVYSVRHIHLQEDVTLYPSSSDDSTDSGSSSDSSSFSLDDIIETTDSDYDVTDTDSDSSSDSDSTSSTDSSPSDHDSEDEQQASDPESIHHDQDNDADTEEDPNPHGLRRMIKTKRRDTINKVSRRYSVDPHLLCEINGNVAGARQMSDGSTRLQPTDHLRFKTELFLPTPSDEERFEASSTASSASDNDEGSHGSTEDSPEPVESKAPAEDNSANAVCAPDPLPRDEQLLPTEYSCLAHELDTKEDNLNRDMAAAYAATPVAFAASPATEELLQQCHHMIQDGFHRAHQMHRTKDANRILHDTRRHSLKLFAGAASTEDAHLVEALRHLKARDIPNPKNYAEAMKSEYQDFWNEAIAEEIANLKAYDVYRFEPLPKGVRPINSRYVFKVKDNQQGLVDRFKARLVVQGFRQRFGIDYLKTHASVCKMQTFRYQMAHAAQHNLLHEIIDVKSAYLEADMKMPVYINIPGHPPPPGMAARLVKSLYGTKQAGRNWHQTIVPLLTTQWSFTQSAADPCMFYHYKDKDDYCVLCLFVDDFSITSTRVKTSSRDTFMKSIKQQFKTSQSDDNNVYLGIRCRRLGPHKMFLDQSLYVKDFVHMYGFDDVRPTATPTSGRPLSKDQMPVEQSEKDAMSKHPYRHIIGSLRYLEQCTRPDISFALNRLSRYQVNPGLPHWQELKHLVRYVSGTQDYGLMYGKDAYPMHAKLEHDLSGPLECFVDSDHAADKDTRRSCTGYIFFSRGGPISWRSRLQHSTALSTCEAEFMAASDAACENAWLRRLVGEFNDLNCTIINGLLVPKDIKAPKLSQRFFTNEVPTLFHEDNIGCIKCSEDPVLHGRMKHIDVKYHRLKEFVAIGQCKLAYVPTDRQIADLFTKALTKGIFQPLRDCMVINPLDFRLPPLGPLQPPS